mmetsp:Transcript_39419/g.111710  ORF Transcript_39419/g.111710 Transcript_39419/m.111710 type:complete len:133 (+) Transcript_39419:782-1180(+)
MSAVIRSSPSVDIAVDPLDGTTLTATGREGAIAVIAIAEKGALFDPGPCMYMEKLAVGPEVLPHSVSLSYPVLRNLQAVAEAQRKAVRSASLLSFAVSVCMLNCMLTATSDLLHSSIPTRVATASTLNWPVP